MLGQVTPEYGVVRWYVHVWFLYEMNEKLQHFLLQFRLDFYLIVCQESYKFGGGRGSGYIVRGGVEVCDITLYCPPS